MYSNDLICDILNYINNNIHKQITVEELSSIFYYNKYYIMKKFKKELNITIINYINSIKIYNSLNLFNKYNTILNIAINSGFNSLEYYSETFMQIMNINPQKYKYFISNLYIKLTDNEINTIKVSTLKLYKIKKNSETYLLRRKPKVLPVKKLSLFK